MEDATIFIWTVANHTRVDGIKYKTPFHTFHCLLVSSLSNSFTSSWQLEMMLYEVDDLMAENTAHFLGTGAQMNCIIILFSSMTLKSFTMLCGFTIRNIKALFSLCFKFSRLTFSWYFSFIFREANSHKGSSLCCKAVKGGGFIAFHKVHFQVLTVDISRLSSTESTAPSYLMQGPWFTSSSSSESYSSTLKLSILWIKATDSREFMKQNPALATWKLTYTSIMVQI